MWSTCGVLVEYVDVYDSDYDGGDLGLLIMNSMFTSQVAFDAVRLLGL